MATFILIPGGWQRGWVYQPITLSGLGDTPPQNGWLRI
jgi:hypothetical protein